MSPLLKTLGIIEIAVFVALLAGGIALEIGPAWLRGCGWRLGLVGTPTRAPRSPRRGDFVDAEFKIIEQPRVRRRPLHIAFGIGCLKVLAQTVLAGLVAAVVAFTAIFGFGADDHALELIKGPTLILGLWLFGAIGDGVYRAYLSRRH